MFPYRGFNLTFHSNLEVIQPEIRVVAGDNKSFVLNIRFVDMDLTDVANIKLFILKPDRTFTMQTAEVVGKASQGTVRVLVESIAVAGIYQGAISLNGSAGERLSFFEFPIVVQEVDK